MTVRGAGCFDMSYSLNSLSGITQGAIIALITGDTQSHNTINGFENIEGWYRDMQGTTAKSYYSRSTSAFHLGTDPPIKMAAYRKLGLS